MKEMIHQYCKNLFKTNTGVWLAVSASFLWISSRLYLRQEVDIPNLVSLIGFILLFFIERSHGREMKAIHLKLDELLAAQAGASNRLIRAEEASEEILSLAQEALHNVASQEDPHAVVSIDHTGFFEEYQLTNAA